MSTFNAIRTLFWPIHRFELKKFGPILLMFFLITFNYNLLRSVKDAIVVTAPESGAEAIPFIKTWVILPMALLITYVFTKLSNRHSREKVFYIMMGLFLAYFLLFILFLYPYQEMLHPHDFCNSLSSSLPQGFQGLISIFRNWTFTSFYVMSELWSSAILTVLFWGFVNAVCKVAEAKRFYGTLCAGANIATIFAGKAAQIFCNHSYNPSIPFGKTAWDQSITLISITIILFGLLILFTFRWLNKQVLSNSKSAHFILNSGKKQKGSFRENFRYLARSKYLICIAILVVSYSLTLNLVEVVWKNQVKALYPNPRDYSNYMGQVITVIGYVATITSIFISGGVIRRCGWRFSALITPVVIFVSGFAFFAFLLCDDLSLSAIAAIFGSSPLILSVFFGSMQNCLSRASKYTLFDATKELAFVPLSDECKHRGKSAIDGVGSRLGKSGGSFFLTGLIFTFGSLSSSIPFIALIFLLVIAIWMFAATVLGKEFGRLAASKEGDDTPSPTEEVTEAKSEAIG